MIYHPFYGVVAPPYQQPYSEKLYDDARYVKKHIHSLMGTTSIELDHTHQYIETTGPAPNGIQHTHEYSGWTNFDDKQRHKISGRTGPAIPLQDGGHIHYYEGFTTGYPNHQHWYQGFTTPSNE
ncbi:YmaF family protein [Lentibacillus sp. Marseille-P4043]|uniref:YmaF family protein n=1 Tax=Lentibacillus sp. Marseille-P4043 TaxID=2040293 RepID=UPI00131A5B20|nr:YmaF family protein [Lentibacillus sp. Marseille-P4043]